MDEKFLTPKEASELAGVTEATMKRLISNREIPFYRPVPGKVYFKHEDVLAWFEKSRIDQDTPKRKTFGGRPKKKAEATA